MEETCLNEGSSGTFMKSFPSHDTNFRTQAVGKQTTLEAYIPDFLRNMRQAIGNAIACGEYAIQSELHGLGASLRSSA